MPLYEYECDACGHRFEIIRKFSDPPIEKCPSCGGSVHKLQSAPAIQFKGSGFYITDYAKKEHIAAAKADSGSAEPKETAEKSEKADKTEKTDKSQKTEAAQKTDKSSPPSDGAASSSASAAKPAPAPSSSAGSTKEP